MNVLRLIRIENLLVIALTQYLMRHAIIGPVLQVSNFELQMSHLDFFLLVLSTVLITAAGYVINDYFDTRTDLLNRPSKVLVGKAISRRTAIMLHWIFNFTGVVLGFYVAISIRFPFLGLLFFIVVLLLWFYSTTFKRQVIVGNILVSVLTGLVPVVVLVFEIPPLVREYDVIFTYHHANVKYMIAWIGFFAFFAFLLNLIREIIKDIEDIEGDKTFGRKTLPVVIGINYTKFIVCALIVITLVSLGYIFIIYLLTGLYGDTDLITFIYFFVFIAIPLLALFYKVIIATEKRDYLFAKNLSKAVMVAGILYAFLVRFIIFQYL